MVLIHTTVCKRPFNIIRNLDTKSANIDDDDEVTRNGDT
jgi:hypothetical protein